jgi:hypothetical protein
MILGLQILFIFSLVNKEKNPFKAMVSNGGKNAIGGGLIRGPIFGGVDNTATDIVVLSNSNTNQESMARFGHAYSHPNYPKDKERASTILAGSEYFQTMDIEVYTILKDY